MDDQFIHKVYVGAHRPLTIWGIERRLWGAVVLAFVLPTGALYASPLGFLVGLFVALPVWGIALYYTHRDPHFLSLAIAICRRGHRVRRRLDCSIPPKRQIGYARLHEASAR